jgi:hypothetical protein
MMIGNCKHFLPQNFLCNELLMGCSQFSVCHRICKIWTQEESWFPKGVSKSACPCTFGEAALVFIFILQPTKNYITWASTCCALMEWDDQPFFSLSSYVLYDYQYSSLFMSMSNLIRINIIIMDMKIYMLIFFFTSMLAGRENKRDNY